MSSTARTQLNFDSVLSLGRPIFALAIIALGVETMVCARYVSHSLGSQYDVIPALPWLPAIPGLAYAFGLIWVVCGAGLFSQRSLRPAAMALGGLLFVCTLILDVPKNAANIGSIGLRTIVFEPFALACLAWLLPGPGAMPVWLKRASRYLLRAVSYRFRGGPLPRPWLYCEPHSQVDPVPCVLGRILWSCVHRRCPQHRFQYPASLGRGWHRTDVRHLGHHSAHPQSSRTLSDSGRTTRSQRMVEPFYRYGVVGWVLGSCPQSAGVMASPSPMKTLICSRISSGSVAFDTKQSLYFTSRIF